VAGRGARETAIAAKRRHPGIDDLQSSSSAALTVGEVALDAKISETALNARWPASKSHLFLSLLNRS
jgi:hypothetical protein